jgi:hypothetical protein
MADESEPKRGTMGIFIGAGAAGTSFGKVVIRGTDIGIEDHGTKSEFGTVRISDAGMGFKAHGKGLRVEDIIISSNVELAHKADREVVRGELAKLMHEADAKVALEVLDDLKAQKPGRSMLDVIEGNPIYRTGRVLSVAVTLFKVLSLLYGPG